MMFQDCFSSRRAVQLIGMRGIMKSKDYIKILNENIGLFAQNLKLSLLFTFQQDNDPKTSSK